MEIHLTRNFHPHTQLCRRCLALVVSSSVDMGVISMVDLIALGQAGPGWTNKADSVVFVTFFMLFSWSLSLRSLFPSLSYREQQRQKGKRARDRGDREPKKIFTIFFFLTHGESLSVIVTRSFHPLANNTDSTQCEKSTKQVQETGPHHTRTHTPEHKHK